MTADYVWVSQPLQQLRFNNGFLHDIGSSVGVHVVARNDLQSKSSCRVKRILPEEYSAKAASPQELLDLVRANFIPNTYSHRHGFVRGAKSGLRSR